MNRASTEILEKWDVEQNSLKQINNSVWQVNDGYILKIYSDSSILQKNCKLLTILEKQGIQVGKIVPTKQGKAYAKLGESSYLLTRKLSGDSITDIQNNTDIAYKMGNVLAHLHKAFQECEKQAEFGTNSLLDEMQGWIRNTFVNHNWVYVTEQEFHETMGELEKLYQKLPVQLIHRDVHLGNFLFDGSKFTGYIDFDLSQRNIRIFDLCYFMLGLISQEDMGDFASDKWFALLRQFFAGYKQECAIEAEEKQAVVWVIESIELLFAAWFIGQNDTACAENAMKIYRFVKKNAGRILETV